MKLFADPIIWIERDGAGTEHPDSEANNDRLRENARSFLKFVEQAIDSNATRDLKMPSSEISYIDQHSWLFKRREKK